MEFLYVAPSCAEAPEPDPACDALHIAADGEFDVKMNSAFTLTTILSTSTPLQLPHHPCKLRRPNRRGCAHLSFYTAPEDVVEEVRRGLADDDDRPFYGDPCPLHLQKHTVA